MSNGDKNQVALEACHLLCEVLPMASIAEIEKILEAALAGVPQVARVIADGPDEHREKAMAAAERSYLKTAQDLGCAEVPSKNWVNAIMHYLRAQVAEQELAKLHSAEFIAPRVNEPQPGLEKAIGSG